MVDQLNNSRLQSPAIDAAATMRRLEAYLPAGQTRAALVVQVTPQATTATAQPLTPASGNPATTEQAPATPSTAKPATIPPTLPPILSPTTATTTPSSTDLFKIQVRLEGRLFELITQKPLTPGSNIQISRDSANRISLQLLPQTQQATAVQPRTTLPISSERGADRPTTTPQAQQATRPSGNLPPGSTVISTTTKPLSSSPVTTQITSNEKPVADPAQSPSPAQPARPTPSASHQISATTARPAAVEPTHQATVERISVQTLKAELSIRLGERLSAEVISSRPNPSPTSTATAAATTSTTPSGAAKPVAGQASSTTPASATETRNDGYRIRINLQGQKIELVSPRPLPPGSQLQLVHDSKGQLWAEFPSAKTQAIEQVLREHLPQQQSPAPLLNLLADSQANGQLQQAKPLLLNLINLLTGRSLTSPQQTDAESVKQQVQNSGSLLENKLARGDTQNLGQDHKALLLRLAQQLGQPSSQAELPKTLSEQLSQLTQQALSRVLVNQITSTLGGQTQEAGTEANRILALDIPIAWQGNTENLELKVQRDANGTDEETGETEYRWRIRLNFEIDGRRQLEAELTLENERISVIWSGDRSIRAQVERQLDKLQQRLEGIGLEVQTLGVRENLPDSEPALKPPRSQLIDIKT